MKDKSRKQVILCNTVDLKNTILRNKIYMYKKLIFYNKVQIKDLEILMSYWEWHDAKMVKCLL